MEALVFYLIAMLAVLVLLRRQSPKLFGILQRILLGSLKGWANFLWGATAKKGKGAKSVPQRMRYRN